MGGDQEPRRTNDVARFLIAVAAVLTALATLITALKR